ncbi:MAG: nucleotidyltransferase family protein [Acidiferrobacterales bacterium]
MKPSIAFQQHRDAIRQIVERHHAKNVRVFGSVLHGQDTDDSDLDILIDTTEETSLFDIGAIRAELMELLGVEVDVLTPGALPDRWKMAVLKEARAL